ncbi:MAG: sulfate adenylyltransferase [Dehalococcoidia bacterium]|nr:sulfate adenylyltransferase [Dehalococcoidia bacterium]
MTTAATATHAIPPHGGTLINRELQGKERDEALARARGLKQIALGPVAVSDLELLAIGGFSPLTGFMGSADYHRVVKEARLANGLVWSLPVTLAVSKEEAASIKPGQELALSDQGAVLGLLTVREQYAYDKKVEAQQVYRTQDEAHPGVARLYQQGDVLLGGEVRLVNHPASTALYAEHQFTPAQSRKAFADHGWKRIVAFQTRNPIHRAHEYIQKCALEVCDGLFLHPLVGETKGDDISVPVRMRSYTRLLEDYYPKDRTLLGVFPAAMRYAGPREAIFHAMVRKNYGCTHLIVGRDHAGVGNYYGTYDAQRIFDDFPAADLGITPLFFEHTFFCKRCSGMASAKTCPHDKTNHVTLSGTQVRTMLVNGEIPPIEFTRPEVAALLAAEMKGK